MRTTEFTGFTGSMDSGRVVNWARRRHSAVECCRVQPVPWNRLRELEGKCEVRIESYLKPPPDRLAWRITIQPAGGQAIVIERPDISEAARDAVKKAQEMGLINH